MSTTHAQFDTEVGTFSAMFNDGGALVGLYIDCQKHVPTSFGTRDDSLGGQVEREIREYLAGERQTFGLELAPSGTPFQEAVWAELATIRYGTTTSYGAIAAAIGRPGAGRAVGGAVGRNPISIIVPCHRVIGASGAPTGYDGGLDLKAKLLALETRVSTR